MFSMNLRDRIPSEELGRKSGVEDVIETTALPKWIWVRYLARVQDSRWIKRIMEWGHRGRKGVRNDRLPDGRIITKCSREMDARGSNWRRSGTPISGIEHD